MFSILNSLINTFKIQSIDETPKSVSLLVKEMETRLEKMPCGSQKETLKQQIHDIKTVAKSNEVTKNLLRTGIVTTKAASAYAGPLAVGVVTYLTHNKEAQLDNEDQKMIRPAKMKAGQRRSTKERRKNPSPPSAISAATQDAFLKIGNDALMASSLAVQATEYGIKALQYGKSFLFG